MAPVPRAVGRARGCGPRMGAIRRHGLRHARRRVGCLASGRERPAHRPRSQQVRGHRERWAVHLHRRARGQLQGHGHPPRVQHRDPHGGRDRYRRRRGAVHDAQDHPPRRGGGRHREQGRVLAGQRPGHHERGEQRDDRGLARAELRRPAAVGPRPERHPDVGARHQHHEPAGNVHAVQLAARAARRAVHLPGLLRADPLGLRSVQPLRHQADRGRARPGLGGVGRQRADRRGEHHHQDAARGAGRKRHPRAPAWSRRGTERIPGTRTAASATYSAAPNDRWSFRVAGGYFKSDAFSRPIGTIPRRDPSAGQRHPYRRRHLPRLREPGHEPAQVRSARRPGADGRRTHHLLGRVRRARRASSTPASGPSTCRTAPISATAAWGSPRVASASPPS